MDRSNLKRPEYTSITISTELSKRIRLLALRNEMKTQKFLESLCDMFENKKDSVLFDQVDEDLKEINAKSSIKKK
jgi:hypothetical protein